MSSRKISEITCFVTRDSQKISIDRLSDEERLQLSQRGRDAIGSALGRYCLEEPEITEELIRKGVFRTSAPADEN